MSKYIKVDDLQSYCDNQKDHTITPNDFQRMNQIEIGWHTGTPTEEGWYLIKYVCIHEGRYKGRLSYRAVKRYKDEIDGYIYEDGGINADDAWKPIEYQKIDDIPPFEASKEK